MKKAKITNIHAVELYLGKYGEENISIEEEIYRYFRCLFGEDFNLIKVSASEQFKNYCEHHNYTRDFVLNCLKTKKPLS